MKTDNFLSKENQKELKQKYTESLKSIYNSYDWYISRIAYYVPMDNGEIVAVDKQTIDKSFWFGWSNCGQGLSFDENNKVVSNVRNNIADYFINKNINSIDNSINALTKILNDKKQYKYKAVKYCRNCDNKGICYNSLIDEYYKIDNCYENSKNKYIEMSRNEMKMMLEALKKLREDTIKKCNTYLKKYGTKYIRISTYWCDR